MEEPNERKELLIKILQGFFNESINIDEVHFLLDLIINDTRRLDGDLFKSDFLDLICSFNDEYLIRYNNSPIEELDVSSLNYVLKDKFYKGLEKFLADLLII